MSQMKRLTERKSSKRNLSNLYATPEKNPQASKVPKSLTSYQLDESLFEDSLSDISESEDSDNSQTDILKVPRIQSAKVVPTNTSTPNRPTTMSLDSNADFVRGLRHALRDEECKELFKELLKPLVQSLSDKVDVLEDRIVNLEKANTVKDDKVEDLEYKLDSVEQRNRKFNLKIYGIPENQGENPASLVEETAARIKASVYTSDIAACYRIGVAKAGTIRPILAKFKTLEAKIRLFNARKALNPPKPKNTLVVTIPTTPQTYVNEDLAPIRSKLLYIARNLKNANVIHKYWIYDSEVYVKRSEFTIDPERATGMKSFREFENHPAYADVIAMATRPKRPRNRLPRQGGQATANADQGALGQQEPMDDVQAQQPPTGQQGQLMTHPFPPPPINAQTYPLGFNPTMPPPGHPIGGNPWLGPGPPVPQKVGTSSSSGSG